MLRRFLDRLQPRPDEWVPVPYEEAGRYPAPVFRGFDQVLSDRGRIAVLDPDPPRRVLPPKPGRSHALRWGARQVRRMRREEDGFADVLPPED